MSVNHSGDTITFTNESTNTDTNTVTNIDGDSGAATNFSGSGSNKVTIAGGTFISTAISGNTLTVSHADTSSQSSVNNSGNNFIQDITLDSRGHITGISSGSVSAGTVTSVSTANGLTGGAITTSGTLQMSGSYSGTFTVTGEIRATQDVIAYSSDDRLKTKGDNIENALDKVKQLNGFHFHWNQLASEKMDYDTNRKMVGVSAQDVEKVLPEAVRPAPADEEFKTVQYEKLVPLLIEAIKDLNAEIEELKSINK